MKFANVVGEVVNEPYPKSNLSDGSVSHGELCRVYTATVSAADETRPELRDIDDPRPKPVYCYGNDAMATTG